MSNFLGKELSVVGGNSYLGSQYSTTVGVDGVAIGGNSTTESVGVDYEVSDAKWTTSIDYTEAGRPFKLSRTGLGDVITASSVGAVSLPQVVGGTGQFVAIDATGNLSAATPAGGGGGGTITGNLTVSGTGSVVGGMTVGDALVTTSATYAYDVTGAEGSGHWYTECDGKDAEKPWRLRKLGLTGGADVMTISGTTGALRLHKTAATGAGQFLAVDTSGNVTAGTPAGVGGGGWTTKETSNFSFGINSVHGGIIATAAGNIAIGNSAGNLVSTGNGNVAIGENSVQGITSQTGNIGIGGNSVRYPQGAHNIGIGQNAAQGSIAITTSVARNIGIGKSTLLGMEDGCGDNTVVGFESCKLVTTGGGNATLGAKAGGAITTGNDNVCIGMESDTIATAVNSIAIGKGAVCSGSNQIVIGNATTTALRFPGTTGGAGQYLAVDSNGNISSATPAGGGGGDVVTGTSTLTLNNNPTNNVGVSIATGVLGEVSLTGTTYTTPPVNSYLSISSGGVVGVGVPGAQGVLTQSFIGGGETQLGLADPANSGGGDWTSGTNSAISRIVDGTLTSYISTTYNGCAGVSGQHDNTTGVYGGVTTTPTTNNGTISGSFVQASLGGSQLGISKFRVYTRSDPGMAVREGPSTYHWLVGTSATGPWTDVANVVDGVYPAFVGQTTPMFREDTLTPLTVAYTHVRLVVRGNGQIGAASRTVTRVCEIEAFKSGTLTTLLTGLKAGADAAAAGVTNADELWRTTGGVVMIGL